jgi:hypothetical protein
MATSGSTPSSSNPDSSPQLEVPFNVGSDEYEDDFDESTADFGNDFDPDKKADTDSDKDAADQEDNQDTKEDTDKADGKADEEAESDDDSDDTSAETEEEEGEETEEPAAESEQKQSQSIPKSRFDAINERRKAAEREAEELRQQLAERGQRNEPQGEQQQQQAPAFDFDAKEQEYMEAVVDGDFDKARAIRGEIRQAEQAEYKRVATEEARTTTSQERAKADLDAEVKAAESKYSVLDKDSEDFDQVLVDEVVDLMGGWVRSGKYSPAQAMKKAVSTVAKIYDLDAEAAVEEPAPPPKPTKKPVSKEEVRKKTKAAASTPPNMSNAGEGVAAEIGVNLLDIDEDEFDALPESKLRELRGDYFQGG